MLGDDWVRNAGENTTRQASMIKKLVVMAVLLSLVLPVNSQAMTGVFMLQKCEATDGTSGRLACAAYMSGTVDALGSITERGWASGICAPKEVTVEQVVLVYVEWAKRNPAKLHRTASDLVIEALQEAFPCEQ